MIAPFSANVREVRLGEAAVQHDQFATEVLQRGGIARVGCRCGLVDAWRISVPLLEGRQHAVGGGVDVADPCEDELDVEIHDSPLGVTAGQNR